MKLFSRPKQIQIVEVPRGMPSLDLPGRNALGSLAEHPGMNYLVNRIRLQRAALESALKYGEQDSLNEMRDLKSGIRWLTWIENQFLLAVERPSKIVSRDPNEDELVALQQSLAFIEGVGESK